MRKSIGHMTAACTSWSVLTICDGFSCSLIVRRPLKSLAHYAVIEVKDMQNEYDAKKSKALAYYDCSRRFRHL
jgi:hypothetical protein